VNVLDRFWGEIPMLGRFLPFDIPSDGVSAAYEVIIPKSALK
jgi:hypothetical protein